MIALVRSSNKVTKPRIAWAREGGAQLRYTAARVRQAFAARRRAGWLAVMPTTGPRHERVTLLRRDHPLAPVARACEAGCGWWDLAVLENLLCNRLDTREGAAELAAAGFALLQFDGTRVELCPADPRVARMINRARLGPQRRGYDVDRVIEALLCLPPRAKRRRHVTDERRLDAALRLQDQWQIDADDLLCRPFVRLCSTWTF
jgi:hypothetical protein